MAKVTKIADVIHGTIPISAIEKRVISTQVFNRLHGIMQNSTAFLTYPSVTHTRWAHSLGVMHLTGRKFIHGYRNAAAMTRRSFLSDAHSQLERIRQGGQDTRNEDHTDSWQGIQRLLFQDSEQSTYGTGQCLKDSFFEAELAGACHGDESNTDWFTLCSVYQAVRLVGLLHDVGHLPFSHVAEHALNEINNDLRARMRDEEDESLSASQEAFLNDYSVFAAEKGAKSKLHENIGKQLSHHLFQSLCDDIIRGGDPLAQTCTPQFVYCSLLMALEIFESESNYPISPIHTALHHLVDGDTDSDRLDYVSRDLVMAGIINAPLPIDRFLYSIELREVTRESGVSSSADASEPENGAATEPERGESQVEPRDWEREYEFLPSARAVSTIETVITHRRMLYRYLVFHHRVQKTDRLLISIIRTLADWLFSGRQVISEDDGGTDLVKEVELLWQTCLWKRRNDTLESYAERLANFDDRWLISYLRRIYRALSSSDAEENSLRARLKDFLTNRKQYHSVIKRTADFWEVDRSAWNEISSGWEYEAIDLQELAPRREKENEESYDRRMSVLGNRYRHIAEMVKRAPSGQAGVESYWAKHGFLLRALHKFCFDELGLKGRDTFIEDSFDDLIGAFQEIDVEEFLTHETELGAGIRDSYHVIDQKKSVPISSVSQITQTEQEGGFFLPPFYSYFRPSVKNGRDISESDVQALRTQVGSTLAERYMKLLKLRRK